LSFPGWRTVTMVGLNALVLTFAAQVPGVPPGDFRPMLSLDLRQFGYEVPKDRRGKRTFPTPHQVVTFIDNNTLAISLFVANPHPGLSVRDKVFGGWYLFETSFVDARTGKLLRTESWSNSTVHSGLFPAPNGGFVVWHDLELSLYAADGTRVKTLALDPKDFPRGPGLKQSPSGKTLFVEAPYGRVLRIRTSDLQQLSWLDLRGYYTGAGSDSYYALLRARPHSSLPLAMDVFIVSTSEQESGANEPRRIFTTSGHCLSIVFLDDETLGVSGFCNDFVILAGSGQVLFEHRFDKVVTGGMTSCDHCDVIVSDTFTLSGGSELLDVPQREVKSSRVFFNRRTKQLFELPDKGTVTNPRSSALAPNGCLLAIQEGPRLDEYNICDSPIR